MTAPKTSIAGPSDTERDRLRAAGFSDDEIARIVLGRTITTGPSTAVPQAPVSGVMGNFSAIWTHARNIIPTMAAQIVVVFSTSAGATARIAALLSVIVKASFVLIFAYVVSMEFSQLRAATDRARVEVCQARRQSLVMNTPLLDERSIAVVKAAQQRDREQMGLPPKQETPEEQAEEKRLQQERQQKQKRADEMYAQWRKDCADVVP